MKLKLWKMVRGVALACCLVVAVAAAAQAQLPDIPGNTGSPVRPDNSAAENAAARRDAAERSRAGTLPGFESMLMTKENVKDQFAQYSAIEKVLGMSLGALRDEYEEDRQELPALQPKQLFALKLLVRSANKMHPGKVNKRGFLDKLKKRVGPRGYLQSRGFTGPEVDSLFNEVGNTMVEVRSSSRR
jgi:hypothetical protein